MVRRHQIPVDEFSNDFARLASLLALICWMDPVCPCSLSLAHSVILVIQVYSLVLDKKGTRIFQVSPFIVSCKIRRGHKRPKVIRRERRKQEEERRELLKGSQTLFPFFQTFIFKWGDGLEITKGRKERREKMIVITRNKSGHIKQHIPLRSVRGLVPLLFPNNLLILPAPHTCCHRRYPWSRRLIFFCFWKLVTSRVAYSCQCSSVNFNLNLFFPWNRGGHLKMSLKEEPLWILRIFSPDPEAVTWFQSDGFRIFSWCPALFLLLLILVWGRNDGRMADPSYISEEGPSSWETINQLIVCEYPVVLTLSGSFSLLLIPEIPSQFSRLLVTRT